MNFLAISFVLMRLHRKEHSSLLVLCFINMGYIQYIVSMFMYIKYINFDKSIHCVQIHFKSDSLTIH